jgi:hypothetical protein
MAAHHSASAAAGRPGTANAMSGVAPPRRHFQTSVTGAVNATVRQVWCQFMSTVSQCPIGAATGFLASDKADRHKERDARGWEDRA